MCGVGFASEQPSEIEANALEISTWDHPTLPSLYSGKRNARYTFLYSTVVESVR